MSDAQQVTWFCLALLLPPAIVLASAVGAAAARRRRIHVDREGLLVLATAPSSLTFLVLANTTPCWPGMLWITLAYFSAGLFMSIAFTFLDWRTHGGWQQCELVFCLLYFGGFFWLFFPFWLVGGAPPL